MQETKTGYKLSSGREIDLMGANGLSLFGDEVRAGYDTQLCQYLDEEDMYINLSPLLTPEEKKEIATYVINQWREWSGMSNE